MSYFVSEFAPGGLSHTSNCAILILATAIMAGGNHGSNVLNGNHGSNVIKHLRIRSGRSQNESLNPDVSHTSMNLLLAHQTLTHQSTCSLPLPSGKPPGTLPGPLRPLKAVGVRALGLLVSLIIGLLVSNITLALALGLG